MLYKSPIPLILHAGFAKETLDVASVLKIQKRLLVELDHTGSGHLQVGEQQFTKDDILTVTEEIKDANTLIFHNVIFDNPELLQLLEHGTVTDRQIPLFSFALRKIPHFQEFRDFVSPFLVQSMAKGLNQSVQTKDFAAARKFLQAKGLITDSDFDRAFGKVKNALESIVHEIERTTKKEIAFSAARFDYITHYFIDFMNELPEGLAGSREEVAIALVNLSVPYHRSQGKFWYLYSYFRLLDCSESLKAHIAKNANTISQGSKSEKQGSESAARSIGFFIIFFIAIAGIARVCSSTDSGSSVEPVTRGLSVSRTEAQHYFLQGELHSIVSAQLTPNGSDSLKNILAQLPTEEKKDGHPYASYFINLAQYKPSSGSVIQLTNRSQLDAVVFVRNDDYAYSLFSVRKKR